MSVSTAPRAVTALFNDPDEFLEELELEAANVERQIVRVTKASKGIHGGALTAVFVEAGCVVEGHLVRLQSYVGSLWGMKEKDDEVQARAEVLVERIVGAVGALGLRVRAGAWVEA